MEKPLERNPIQTFVFLDIESTAVLAMDKPKMTEICLTAVHRKELLDVSRIRTTVGIRLTPKLPRVTDSLSICLNPGKPVHSVAYELSGLDNTNLNGSCKRQFGELDATLLKLFLTRQARPICLIAHNGMEFDFPLLKAELKGINYNFPILDIKCGDTLQAFRDLDDGLDVKRELPKKWHVPFSQAYKLANSPIDMAGSEKKRLRTSVARCLFSKSLLPGSTQGASECIGHDRAQHIIVREDHDRKLDVPDQHQSGLRVKRTCGGSQGFDLADSYKRPRRVDYIPTKDDPLRLATPSPPRRNGGRYSYKLVDVYQHMFGQLPDKAHHAVSDVNTLLAIFVARADSLIKYFENNSVNFGVIPIFYGKGA